jgi:hypothetical protein
MKDRPLYRAIALAALVTLIGCKKKPTASEGGEPARAAASNAVSSAQSAASAAAAAASHVIQSKDEVCNLLTRAEVGEELKKPMQPRARAANVACAGSLHLVSVSHGGLRAKHVETIRFQGCLIVDV